MVEITATATEMQNNFGKYLKMILNGNEVIVTRNGKSVARFIPSDVAISYLTDSLTGILSDRFDYEAELEKGLIEKYESAD